MKCEWIFPDMKTEGVESEILKEGEMLVKVTVLQIEVTELMNRHAKNVEISTRLQGLQAQEQWLVDAIHGVNESISFNRHWRDSRLGSAYSDGASDVRHNLIVKLTEIREEIKRVSVASKQRDPEENIFGFSLP